jgi:hypothetical protein
MKRLMFFFICVSPFINSYSQDFRTDIIEKKVKEFDFNDDFSTPLKAFVSIQYLLANGQLNELLNKSTLRFHINSKGFDNKETTKEFKSKILNCTIKEIITYCDSIAEAISIGSDSIYLTTCLFLEQKNWVNGGEGGYKSLEEAENDVFKWSPLRLIKLRRTCEVLNTPTDTIAFLNYLKENGKPPKQFLLEALAEHKLVIYGERHREKLSWQLLKDVVNDPTFRKTTGTVFMELQSYKQPEIDKFFANVAHMDSSILIGVYQDMQANGWFDKGGFEFLINLWKLNKQLAEKERIKVVFTDFQPQLRKIKTKEEMQNFRNDTTKTKRNTHMADVIERTIKTSTDTRNNLFIVGYGHAYKSSAIDDEGRESPEDDCSAANQLVKRFSSNDIFCTRVHTSGFNGYTRGGIFDSVFAKLGGKPIAFKLKGSPFGKEIIEEWAWAKDDFGSFENNYDGYIYLGGEPIDKQREYRLSDIYTEDFVKEIIRRAYLMGAEDEMWFGVPNKLLTIEVLLKI